MADGNSLRDLLWCLEVELVIRFTRHAWDYARVHWMSLKTVLRIYGTGDLGMLVRKGCSLRRVRAWFPTPKIHSLTCVTIACLVSNKGLFRKDIESKAKLVRFGLFFCVWSHGGGFLKWQKITDLSPSTRFQPNSGPPSRKWTRVRFQCGSRPNPTRLHQISPSMASIYPLISAFQNAYPFPCLWIHCFWEGQRLLIK